MKSDMHTGWLLRRSLAIFLLCLTFFLGACASARRPVPTGTVPEQGEILAADEQYGNEVLSQLSQTYPLDRDDARINRVTDIVDRLTKAARADRNPWHVYVLKGDTTKNAAATRGNFVFVWTGILNATKTDGELATILAHEIGHVLAGHTAEDPAAETNKIIAGIAGAATSGVISSRGLGGPASDLAELIVRASLEALLVNPDQQSKELEADEIGIFLMADAGYDPQEALNFWDRVQTDPDFQGFPLEFMSSHPSSASRLQALASRIEDARSRYERASGKTPKQAGSTTKTVSQSVPRKPLSRDGKEVWEVQESSVEVFADTSRSSKVVDNLRRGTQVKVKSIQDRWLEISEPVAGYVQSRELAPVSGS